MPPTMPPRQHTMPPRQQTGEKAKKKWNLFFECAFWKEQKEKKKDIELKLYQKEEFFFQNLILPTTDS